MTFARIDRMLTRLWLGLAAGLALAGGLRLGAAVGHRGPARADEVQCAQVILTGAAMRRGEPVFHRDPRGGGNLMPPRP